MKTILLGMIILTSLAHGKELSLTDHNSIATLKGLSHGQQITLTDVELDHFATVSLNLKRFRVFAEDAQIIIHDEKGISQQAMPDNAYFTGRIQGVKDSDIFIGFLESGEIFGFVKTADQPTKELRQIRNNQFKLLTPDNHKSSVTDNREWNPRDYLELPDDIITQRQQYTVKGQSAIDYQFTLAVETDFEFYKKFNSTTLATNYISGLIGYISSIYYREVKTYILLGEVTIWTENNDPWDATSAQCALYEVGKYWNDNKHHVKRATTHFMSGKNFGGGIAWLGVLCQGPFNYDISSAGCPGLTPTSSNYGGGYGVTGSLSGSFNPGNPQIGWDLLGISHEIGHNFGSRHTHCYGGVAGNANPVDECFNAETGAGCYTGVKTLPGPAGQGSGTIMSYCHTLNGGMNNIAITLGKNHNFGVQPQRVPNVMRDHVETVASWQPQCIMPALNDLIFLNGFE